MQCFAPAKRLLEGARFTEFVVSLDRARRAESWLGEFEQGDEWSFCLIAARMAADQERVDDETSAPEPQPGIQGESGIGCFEGREDVGRVGAAIRRSRQSDHAMEGAASGRGGRDIRG